jgi:hypothetical protein
LCSLSRARRKSTKLQISKKEMEQEEKRIKTIDEIVQVDEYQFSTPESCFPHRSLILESYRTMMVCSPSQGQTYHFLEKGSSPSILEYFRISPLEEKTIQVNP